MTPETSFGRFGCWSNVSATENVDMNKLDTTVFLSFKVLKCISTGLSSNYISQTKFWRDMGKLYIAKSVD